MAKSLDWDSRIGRRMRLRDLHILFAVVQHGSMAKAGAELGISQSAISQAIAALESTLNVRLLDRTSRGVELTVYGAALMRRGQAAFDELRAGVNDIELLTNPEVGEVRVACTESIAAGVLPPVIERFSLQYPKVKLHAFQTSTHLMGFAALDERKADVVLTLLSTRFEGSLPEHLKAERLFNDRICLVTAARSQWARRRKIELGDLVDAALVVPDADTQGGAVLTEAFRAAGLPISRSPVTTFSVHLRSILSMRGRFIAVLPASILRFNPDLYPLRELPIALPMPQLPAVVVTLKNRTLSAPVERFIECARAVAGEVPIASSRRKTGLRGARGAATGEGRASIKTRSVVSL
jgi:DNA-binding transcriptional LysR family regulator